MMRQSKMAMAAAIAVVGAAGSRAPALAEAPATNASTAIQLEEVKKALSNVSIVAVGERSFVKCQGCHMVGEKAQRRVGPALNGVIGRAAGANKGFVYSSGMQSAAQSGLVWTVEALDAYLKAPRERVPATSMAFAGIPKPDERKALIAYLASFQEDGSRVDLAPK